MRELREARAGVSYDDYGAESFEELFVSLKTPTRIGPLVGRTRTPATSIRALRRRVISTSRRATSPSGPLPRPATSATGTAGLRAYDSDGGNALQAFARRYFGDAGEYLALRIGEGTSRDDIRNRADLEAR